MDDRYARVKRKYQATVEDEEDKEYIRQGRPKRKASRVFADEPEKKGTTTPMFKRSKPETNSEVEAGSKTSEVEKELDPLRFLGGEIRLSLLPAMYRKGSDYMNILEKASWYLDSLGQRPSAQALASAHHQVHDKDLMITGSVMAVAMENEILKAQMKVVLQRLGEIASRVDALDRHIHMTQTHNIDCKTCDELREKLMSGEVIDLTSLPSALTREPLELRFSKISLEDMD